MHFIIPDGSLVLNPEQIGSAPIFCSRAGLNQSPRRGRRRAEAREVTRPTSPSVGVCVCLSVSSLAVRRLPHPPTCVPDYRRSIPRPPPERHVCAAAPDAAVSHEATMAACVDARPAVPLRACQGKLRR